MKYTIDAKGRVPGRVATEAAVLLIGKNKVDYARNKVPNVEVEVLNVGALSLEAKKLKAKSYYRHSGYPGALKSESMQQVVDKKGAKEVLRRAVYGMLPKNKLRPRMMKNLKIRE
jgi:large subunit ribosomal protein L13